MQLLGANTGEPEPAARTHPAGGSGRDPDQASTRSGRRARWRGLRRINRINRSNRADQAIQVSRTGQINRTNQIGQADRADRADQINRVNRTTRPARHSSRPGLGMVRRKGHPTESSAAGQPLLPALLSAPIVAPDLFSDLICGTTGPIADGVPGSRPQTAVTGDLSPTGRRPEPDRRGIPWPRSARRTTDRPRGSAPVDPPADPGMTAHPLISSIPEQTDSRIDDQADGRLGDQVDGQIDGQVDDQESPAVAPTEPISIDLSEGPKLIRRPAPTREPERSTEYRRVLPAGPVDRSGPSDRTDPSGRTDPSDQDRPTGPVVPVHRNLTGTTGRDEPGDDRDGHTIRSGATGLLPAGALAHRDRPAGVDLRPSPPAGPGEPRQIPEALLATVLSVIASAEAWSLAAPSVVWLTLSALPAAGLLALLLPGGTTARVLRAIGLSAAAAALPVLDPAMTPASLVIIPAAAAVYPLLLPSAAGWLVTLLNVVAPAGALVGRILLDGPDQLAQVLHPQGHPEVSVQVALGSGVLVAGLVGVTATLARRRLAGPTSAGSGAERQARVEDSAIVASISVGADTALTDREGLLRILALILPDPDPLTRGSTTRPVGLVLADLDRFDELADSLGSRVADHLSAVFGERITEALPGHLVARVSRRQFAVVLTDDKAPANSDSCADLARTLTRLTGEPVITPGGREVALTCCLGGAVSGPGLSTAEDLLQAADEAVRTAQQSGPARWAMFDRSVRARSRRRADLADELRQAIARGLVEVDFQPMLALGSGLEDDRITGTEVVARWRRRDGSRVPAEVFVPLADELGLGPTLGLQMINRALAALVIWRHQGIGIEQVWLRLSPAQLEDPDFAHEVAAQLAIRGLQPSSMTLQVGAGELDETGSAVTNLRVLRSLGIPVALNDFGCSGTSLTMLRRLPIGAVKLDGRLTADLDEGDDVPRAAAQLCRTLGLRVICGSVTTSGQLEGARQIGADAVQGQVIARPMSAGDLTNLLTVRSAGGNR